ncbi:Uncharacterised protein [Vibrio cholerae]|uniref:Uncharacterized protein n=1 Tax=Vibrio cholerae TaxID=666 RepID=A0A655PL39_VIBCL|nr:Uncharacterised protein [Vibrio cholerae]
MKTYRNRITYRIKSLRYSLKIIFTGKDRELFTAISSDQAFR